jgi:hypothetical protein
MTSAEEQQMFDSLSDISQELLAITRDQFRRQDEADEKACRQPVNVACKR